MCVLLNSGQQFILAEWFGEILVRADDATLCLVEQAILGRQHNNGGGFEFTVVLAGCKQSIESVSLFFVGTTRI